MTPVMTFHEASGLRVWCGLGVLSGKNREPLRFLVVGDKDRGRPVDGLREEKEWEEAL